MRKGALVILLACALMLVCGTGCTDKNVGANDTLASDSIIDTSKIDTLEELIAEQPMPKAADELFDDFIFNFAANKKLQRSRIAFPLPVKGDSVELVGAGQWQTEHFFMEQGFYTLILDNRKQLRLSKDTSVNHAEIEKIDLGRKSVMSYNFDRLSGKWNMTSIERHSLASNVNASFLAFYDRFSSDEEFLMASLGNPISFTGPDPDDDFKTITENISPERWPEIGLEDLPKKLIYNIIYGQKYTNDNQKVFLLRGIANGLEVELTFRRVDGAWKLVKVVE